MYLSDSFIEQYKDKEPPFGGNGLGHFAYLRTYSRWNDSKMRRETWQETIRRVVEYSIKLYQGPATKEELTKEAELLFDSMFHLKVFPAGRTLWVGGTEAANKFGSANFNCAFITIDSLSSFTDTFHLLMVGSGVGFRVLPTDVNKLPQFNTNIVIAHKPYYGKPKNERLEDTLVYEDKDDSKTSVLIVVGDSKGGWVTALQYYLEAMTQPDVESIVINYDSVRPAGEELKTFGGRSSGHQALKNMFRKIHKVIIKSPLGKLRTIDAMDIENHIAMNVVVGGVRRSSQICLFDISDSDIMNAKLNMWQSDSKNYGQDQRSMSNNSVFFNEKPSKEDLRNIFSSIQVMGEPGFVNAEAARKRRPNFEGLNPCGEILLDSKGVCNLTEVNMPAFIKDGEVLYDYLVDSVKLATRIGLRQTNINFDLPEWDTIQKRDRLTGVSLDGVMDFESKLGWDKEPRTETINNDWFTLSIGPSMAILLESLKYESNQEALRYAHEMRIPAPLLVTTIKPSGTISKLPMISSGVHKSRAPYYIRRIRITASDPLAKVMLDSGYKTYPLFNSTNKLTESIFDSMSSYEKVEVLQKSNTWVIEFPVKSATSENSSDESAISQLGRYLDFQKYWTNHNTSITIQFDESEIDQLVDMIYEYWDDYVAVSFMPKDTTAYPQLPEEAITEEEYLKRIKPIENITQAFITQQLIDLERENKMTELLDSDCEGGACPIR